MSRILIISTSREMAPQPTVPLGAAWVAQALHIAGFEVRLLDLCFERGPLSAVGRALDDFRPDGIGISVRNLDNCDFLSPLSFLPELKEITDFIKSRSGARILLGGAGVSIMPLQVLEFLELDHAVAGEGETAAVLFYSAPTLREAALAPGVVSRRREEGSGAGGGWKSCPVGDPIPLLSSPLKGEGRGAGCSVDSASGCVDSLLSDSLLSDSLKREGRQGRGCDEVKTVQPATQRWVQLSRYLRLEPVLPVQGKRGCANRCLYCTYNRIEGRTWRMRDPIAVADEIEAAMRETGATEFEFVDSVFNEPEGYLESVLEEIVRRRLRAMLRVSSLSPKGLTKDQIRLMERAGMTSLVITPETACDATLAALGKNFSENDLHHAAELLANSSIKALWCFLMGGPGEDEGTLTRTVSFINSRIGRKDSSFITTGIRIYPGTGLHQVAITEGLVDPRNNLLMPSFYFSPRLSLQRAQDVLLKNIADLSRCIFLSDTRKSSLGTWRRLATMLKVPGPFWHYAGYMNRLNAGTRIIKADWAQYTASRK